MINRIFEPKAAKKVDGPTAHQKAVAMLPAKEAVVVCAPAGSGKTYTLVHRIGHLIEEEAVPSHVLVLSFTNAAVDEIRRRLVENELTRDYAYQVRVLTIDRFAHGVRVRAELSESDLAGGGLHRNITQATELLRLRSLEDLADRSDTSYWTRRRT